MRVLSVMIAPSLLAFVDIIAKKRWFFILWSD
jgi:hypothetical protein